MFQILRWPKPSNIWQTLFQAENYTNKVCKEYAVNVTNQIYRSSQYFKRLTNVIYDLVNYDHPMFTILVSDLRLICDTFAVNISYFLNTG